MNDNDKPKQVQKCEILTMAKVKPEKIEWLWDGKVAIGKLNLWQGDGENAKSLTTLDIASKGSVGKPMPGETEAREPFSTILITSEDEASDTIRPRLDVAGADCSKVHTITTIDLGNGEKRPIQLPNDIVLLENTIDELGDCKLLVIDPVSQFWSGVNDYKDSELRPALAQLAQLAARKRIAVIMILHLNKGEGRAKQRGNGSVAYINVSRSVWLFVEDKNDSTKYLMLRVKGNNTQRKKLTGISFRLEDVEGYPKINWLEEPVYISADEALSLKQPEPGKPTTEKEKAKDFLLEVLKEGPVPTATVRIGSGNRKLSESTLNRAAEKLGVVKNRNPETGLLEWSLPSSPPSKVA